MEELRKKQLRAVIKDLINEYVGYNENHWLDNDETWTPDPSVEECENYIYDILIHAKKRWLENGLVIDCEQLKFLGTEHIKMQIKLEIVKDYLKDKWIFPHKELKF